MTRKTDFHFALAGRGVYLVTYTSPRTGKQWYARIKDMDILDKTKNTEEPKKIHLEILKRRVKNG